MTRTRVPLTGAGTGDDPLRPNLPDGAGYSVVTHHGDGTVTVDYDDPDRPEALRVAARISVVDKVRADELDDDTVATIAPLFPDWQPGVAVAAGEVYRWDGTLVEVIQGHRTQADWAPDAVPALFKVHRTAGTVSAWVQPFGAHDAYRLGDQVTHNGVTYTSDHDANVWAPPTLWTAV